MIIRKIYNYFLINKISILLENKEYGQIINLLLTATNKFPNYSYYYLELARLYKIFNHDLSIQYYQKAISLNNKHATFELYAMNQPKQFINPQSLIGQNRIDVIVKIAYIQHKLGLVNHSSLIESIYEKMILKRTKGKEPGSIFKNNINKYKNDFLNLAKSIQENGFNHDYPVFLNGKTILNGSHRIAIAIALNIDSIPVIYFKDSITKPWDLLWFHKNGFSNNEIEYLSNMKTYHLLYLKT